MQRHPWRSAVAAAATGVFRAGRKRALHGPLAGVRDGVVGADRLVADSGRRRGGRCVLNVLPDGRSGLRTRHGSAELASLAPLDTGGAKMTTKPLDPAADMQRFE